MQIKNLKIFVLFVILVQYTYVYAATKAPIKGEFYVSTKNLNISKPIELTLSFALLRHFEDIEVKLTLPQGVSLLDGVSNQQFKDLEIDKSKNLKYSVHINEDKEYQILITVKVLNLIDAAYSKDFIIILNSKGNIPPPMALIE